MCNGCLRLVRDCRLLVRRCLGILLAMLCLDMLELGVLDLMMDDGFVLGFVRWGFIMDCRSNCDLMHHLLRKGRYRCGEKSLCGNRHGLRRDGLCSDGGYRRGMRIR